MQQPSFDTWTSGFLIAVAMGLFLFGLLLSTKNKKNNPIAFFVLAFTLILFQYVLYWTGYQFKYPYFIYLPTVCYYLTGPLLYLYFLQLYHKKPPASFILHFLPAAMMLIPYVGGLLRNVSGSIEYIPMLSISNNPWIIAGHMAVYVVLLFHVKRNNSNAASEYATIRNKWATVLASLYSLFLLAYLSYFILVNFDFFNDQWDYAISFTMSLSIYAIGYFIFKQPAVFNGEFHASFFLPDRMKKETLEDQMLTELYQKITTHMETAKPYTDNELRLSNLADQLGFSTHLLSKVINTRFGGNFNTFVNTYRLEAAESLLKKEQTASVKSVYFDVGFNSKASFYNAFKKKHDCTPLQYRKQCLLS